MNKQFFRSTLHFRRRGWMVLDVALSTSAILIAYAMQPHFVFGWESSNPSQPGAYQAALFYPVFAAICLHIAGLHDPLGDRRRWLVSMQIAVAIASALGLSLLVLYISSLQEIGRNILFRTFVINVSLLALARGALWKFASESPRRIGCFLCSPARDRLLNQVKSTPRRFEVVSLPTNADPEIVVSRFQSEGVEEVLVSTRDEQRAVWLECLNRGLQVTDVSVFFEREYYQVACQDIDLDWFLTIDLKWNHPFYHRTKRLLDVLLSSIACMVCAPLFLASAILVAADDGLPFLYSQTRVGFRGKPYRIWKLRTMRRNAESRGPEWAKTRDSRITRVGHVFRRMRLDELPQLWNVLVGDMSLIGPRPERPEFVDQLASAIPLYHQRHWIKPGITGWAQINYPYGASVDDARAKLAYDLYYLKNASFLLDLHIALRTIGALARGSR